MICMDGSDSATRLVICFHLKIIHQIWDSGYLDVSGVDILISGGVDTKLEAESGPGGMRSAASADAFKEWKEREGYGVLYH
jgi:hypothetical protein